MIDVKVGKYKLKMYESINELPVERYHMYNKMLMVDAGVGSTIESFDLHIEKVLRFMKDKPDLAAKELENLRQNVYLLQERLSPRNLAFCALVAEVNGKPQDDITSGGLKRLAKKFDKVIQKDIDDILSDVKKKISDELELYFPQLFDDVDAKEYVELIRRRALLQCDSLIENKDLSKEIDVLTLRILSFNAPKTFSGKESEEIKIDKQFEEMCLGLSQVLGLNVKKFTVMEYYSAFEHIKKNNGRKSNKVQ